MSFGTNAKNRNVSICVTPPKEAKVSSGGMITVRYQPRALPTNFANVNDTVSFYSLFKLPSDNFQIRLVHFVKRENFKYLL
jgi:hypothetical protein